MADRLERATSRLLEQLRQAASGATSEGAAWPASAPSAAELTANHAALEAAVLASAQAKAAWQKASSEERALKRESVGLIRRVDEATDLLYGPTSVDKERFGLRPKGSQSLPPLAQLTRLRAADGSGPGSISLRWRAIRGCVYEVQWSLSSDFEEILGGLLSTRVTCEIEGLVPRQQVWMRVRPVRANKYGPWSDPETRVAPL